MGVINRTGGSFLAWWRLSQDIPGTPLPPGGNCREPYGIIRNYDDPQVRFATQDVLRLMKDNDQCVIRTGLYLTTELSSGGTIHNHANGLTALELNNLKNFLTDIKAEGFDVHFAYFPIHNDRPYTWSSWQAQRFAAHVNVIQQTRPIITSIFAPGEYLIELHNEGQGAGNQPQMVRYAWELYREYGNLFGIADTTGSSVGYSAMSAGLSRYNIQFSDYQNPAKGLHGLPQYQDVHGYTPFTSTGLLELNQAMIANGDTRDLIIGETYYSTYTNHVNAVLSQIAQLQRDVEYVTQWPLTPNNGCDGHVDVLPSKEFDYKTATTTSCRLVVNNGISCSESSWS